MQIGSMNEPKALHAAFLPKVTDKLGEFSQGMGTIDI